MYTSRSVSTHLRQRKIQLVQPSKQQCAGAIQAAQLPQLLFRDPLELRNEGTEEAEEAGEEGEEGEAEQAEGAGEAGEAEEAVGAVGTVGAGDAW